MNKSEIIVEQRPASSLALFAAKTVMVGIVAVISAWIVSGIFVGKLANLMDERVAMIERRIDSNLPSNSTRRGIVAILERELMRTATSDFELPPEQQKHIIADLRRLSDRWRLFFIEASSALIMVPPFRNSGPAIGDTLSRA